MTLGELERYLKAMTPEDRERMETLIAISTPEKLAELHLLASRSPDPEHVRFMEAVRSVVYVRDRFPKPKDK